MAVTSSITIRRAGRDDLKTIIASWSICLSHNTRAASRCRASIECDRPEVS
jgi:hypothetical protein